jgi:hypothetical protein
MEREAASRTFSKGRIIQSYWARSACKHRVALLSEFSSRNLSAAQGVFRRAQQRFFVPLQRRIYFMAKQSIMFAATALLMSCGIASAQAPARDLPDAANPSAGTPAPNNARTGTPERPPAATMPDANMPDPITTGRVPASSEKMQREMDNVGGGKTAPGDEKK